MSKPTTISQVQNRVATAIRNYCGADVEFTMMGNNKCSIFTLDEQRFCKVITLMKLIPSLVLDSTCAYPDENGNAEFYAYFNLK